MRGRLGAIVSILCLLLCAATGVLWARSYTRPPGGEDQAAVYPSPGTRTTLRIDRGRLVVLAPPEPPAGRTPTRNGHGETAESLAALLSEDQLQWTIDDGLQWFTRDGQQVSEPFTELVGPALRRPTRQLVLNRHNSLRPGEAVYPEAEVLPALLRTLEDPTRFAAAHVALAWVTRRRNRSEAARPDGSYVQIIDGLRIELRPDPDAPIREESTPGGLLRHQQCIVRIDPAQLPAIRDQWHRRLDVEVGSASLGWVAAATSAVPVLSLLVPRVRARRRRRAGRCPVCGYDLRASPIRCPECGAMVRPIPSG